VHARDALVQAQHLAAELHTAVARQQRRQEPPPPVLFYGPESDAFGLLLDLPPAWWAAFPAHLRSRHQPVVVQRRQPQPSAGTHEATQRQQQPQPQPQPQQQQGATDAAGAASPAAAADGRRYPVRSTRTHTRSG
jgi:hypothetical protein